MSAPARTLEETQAAATDAVRSTALAHVVFRYTDRTDGARLLRFGFVPLREWREAPAVRWTGKAWALHQYNADGPNGSKAPVFRVYEVQTGGRNGTGWTHALALVHYMDRIRESEAAASRARTYKDLHTREAAAWRAERAEYCAFFGLPAPGADA